MTATHPFSDDQLPIFIIPNDKIFPAECDSLLGVPEILENGSSVTKELGIDLDDNSGVLRGDGTLKNSAQFTGMNLSQAREEVCQLAKEKGVGGHRMSSRLRDWLISRQR